MNIYCLFCETGREAKVEDFLNEAGYRVITSLAMQGVIRRGKLVREPRALLPGYVFFENDREPDEKTLKANKYVYRLLRYDDGAAHLRGKDLDFIRLLFARNGVFGVSKAIQVGSRIKILDGPLKDYEGDIVRLNRRRQNAEVRIESEGFIHTVWLSYEVIEKKDMW
ncbi:MAG: transcription antitermination protein NusG [Treponematales bacterium]